MKTTVHVIGPKDNIARVEQVALEFADRLSLITFIYTDVEEVPEIIAKHDHEADLWLFTGRVSYAWSKQFNLERKSLIIQSQGSALMKQLHLAYRDGYTRMERLSMDTLAPDEVAETMREMELKGMPLIYPQHFYVPAAELVSFHEDAYRNGKVDACITHRGFVFETLKLRGIPTYRSKPTIVSIRQALHLACQRGEANHFRKSQIAMLHVHINLPAVTAKKSYEGYWMNLKVQETILRYTEHISGALLPTGSGTFTVLSTRGALEQQAADFPAKLLAEQVQLVTGGNVAIGIGYGLTALDAEQNASIALTHATEQEKCGVVFVDEHGTITVALGEQETLAYKYRTNDLATLEQLGRAGISVATYHKFAAVQASSGQRAVSAAYIAARLGMTKRNANRILTDLEHCGLAVIVGEEAPTKGRPRKLYRIGG